MNIYREKCGLLSGVSGSFVAALLLSQPACAQSDANEGRASANSEPGNAEIIVTATRQERALSKVPLSIVATSQETLDKQGVRDIEGITRTTPGITFRQSAALPGTTNIFIRGVVSTSGIPTTGVYIDDMPVQARTGTSPILSNPYPKLFDLDRVEVLRGPQGTLFGSGSVGGAVRFITPGPSLSGTSVYGRAEVATTEHGAMSYEAGLAGGAPIVEDKLGFRASVWYRRDGGYVDKLDRITKVRGERDTNWGNSYVARLALGWKPTETLTITPSIFFQDTYVNDHSAYEADQSKPGD